VRVQQIKEISKITKVGLDFVSDWNRCNNVNYWKRIPLEANIEKLK